MLARPFLSLCEFLLEEKKGTRPLLDEIQGYAPLADNVEMLLGG